jgi:sn-glycerol 3-phosphate transport system substrate-binding protein
MLSMPFNSSTMVMYYNKDAFKKAGLDPEKPPKTWPELRGRQEAKKAWNRRLRQVRLHERLATWANIEKFGAWHNRAARHQGQRLRPASTPS